MRSSMVLVNLKNIDQTSQDAPLRKIQKITSFDSNVKTTKQKQMFLSADKKKKSKQNSKTKQWVKNTPCLKNGKLLSLPKL
jgi:hypothetical protein